MLLISCVDPMKVRTDNRDQVSIGDEQGSPESECPGVSLMRNTPDQSGGVINSLSYLDLIFDSFD